MSKRRIVDSAKLIDAVEEGRLDKEVITKFGLKTRRRIKGQSSRTKSAREKMKRSSGKRVETGAEVLGTIKVNEWGSVIVPKSMTEILGIAVGERFEIRRTKAGLFLKRI